MEVVMDLITPIIFLGAPFWQFGTAAFIAWLAKINGRNPVLWFFLCFAFGLGIAPIGAIVCALILTRDRKTALPEGEPISDDTN
jgi:hypothetical protein